MVIVGEGGEAAAADHCHEAVVEGGGEDGVVAAERVADGADPLGIDLGKARKQIDPTEIVPDGLHAPACGAAVGCLEVVGIFAERWVIGNEADKAALGQLVGVVEIGEPPEPRRLVLADVVGLVEAEHGRGRGGGGRVRDEEPGGNAIAGLGGVVEFTAEVAVGPFLVDHLDLERHPAVGAGERAHDQFHPPTDDGDLPLPLRRRGSPRRLRPIGVLGRRRHRDQNRRDPQPTAPAHVRFSLGRRGSVTVKAWAMEP